jgi:hypothetical protein
MSDHPINQPAYTAERLRFFATAMEAEGFLSAARHMRNGADCIEQQAEALAARSRLSRHLIGCLEPRSNGT